MKTTILLALISLNVACSNEIFRDGKNGRDGKDGGACSVLSLADGSGALITCPDSTAFISNGKDGRDGEDGTDATPVTIVQFCPTVNGSYISGNFPEKGFIINGRVYGVYSANGKASLAELYPGRYQTTAPGINCSFTVNNNGTISN